MRIWFGSVATLLPPELYGNYMKLVTAIDIAIDFEITFENVTKIKTLLREFVLEYEELYYQYNASRLPACLPTLHLLLHLADCISACGPSWVFWQFPCERICGMLKEKVKCRVSANRNLALGILHEDRLNHLPFACQFAEQRTIRNPISFTSIIDDREFKLLHTRRCDTLSVSEATRLADCYASTSQDRRADILRDPAFSREIIKWGRCRIAGDTQHISSSWYASSRRKGRMASFVRCARHSHHNRHNRIIVFYGQVIFFFTHEAQGKTQAFAYLQKYRHTDHSLETSHGQGSRVVEMKREGAKEVVWISDIQDMVGVMISRGKQYVLNRRNQILAVDDGDEE
jgi:hypothetical protein